jgi:hypothetical protein
VSQPAFTEQELVLVLDYFLANARGEPRSLDELSSTLRGLGVHRNPGDPVAFRNVEGLARAARRFRFYEGTGIDRDTVTYRRVWERYAADPNALRAAVASANRGTGTGSAGDGYPRGSSVGRPYISADEAVVALDIDPFSVDPKALERSLRSHARLQNQLARDLELRGLAPLRAQPDDPQFDLAWEDDGALWVAEIKSLSDGNEERQMRLGLGQLLFYRHLLATPERTIEAMLFVERQPRDKAWCALCIDLGMELLWPGKDRGYADVLVSCPPL